MSKGIKWTFRAPNFVVGLPPEVTVETPDDDETEARHLAMLARWGTRAAGIGGDIFTGKHSGKGLELISKMPA